MEKTDMANEIPMERNQAEANRTLLIGLLDRFIASMDTNVRQVQIFCNTLTEAQLNLPYEGGKSYKDMLIECEDMLAEAKAMRKAVQKYENQK